jgi:hypothetical protein
MDHEQQAEEFETLKAIYGDDVTLLLQEGTIEVGMCGSPHQQH